MQESERKYKWYYSPKCTFKNEKKAGREKTMVSVLTRAKKCAKISFVFEKDAGVAQSVEQLIRNQQVRCSSHPTSSKKHRKLRFSMLFCCKNAENGVGQNAGQALTHTVTHKRNKLYPRKWTRDFDPWSRSADTHLTHRGSQRLCRLLPAHAPWVQRNARKDPKSTGEKLLPFRCSACLRDLSNLRHEAAHFLRGLLLHLPCDVGVGSQGESRVVVTEH